MPRKSICSLAKCIMVCVVIFLRHGLENALTFHCDVTGYVYMLRIYFRSDAIPVFPLWSPAIIYIIFFILFIFITLCTYTHIQ